MARVGKLVAQVELPSFQRRSPQLSCKKMARSGSAQQARVVVDLPLLRPRSELQVKKAKKVIACLEGKKNNKTPSSSSSSPSPVKGCTISLLNGDVEKELSHLETSSYASIDTIERDLREWELMCYNGVKIEPSWEAPVIGVNETAASNNETGSSINEVKGFNPSQVIIHQVNNVVQVMKKTSPINSKPKPKPNPNHHHFRNVVLEVKKKTSSTTQPATANNKLGINASGIGPFAKVKHHVVQVKKKTLNTTAANSKTAGRTNASRIGPYEPIRNKFGERTQSKHLNKIKKGLMKEDVKVELNLKEEREKEERERSKELDKRKNRDISSLCDDVEKELRCLERICYTKEEREYEERERRRMVLSNRVERELTELEEMCYAEGEREMQEREMQAREKREREEQEREKREREMQGREKREREMQEREMQARERREREEQEKREREMQERERTRKTTLYDATPSEILQWKMQYLCQNFQFLSY